MEMLGSDWEIYYRLFKARGIIHLLHVLGQKHFTQLPPTDPCPFYLAVCILKH